MKAKITRPDGTVVEVEGDVDEILKLIQAPTPTELVFGDFFWPKPERPLGCPGIVNHPSMDMTKFRFMPCEHDYVDPSDTTSTPHCRKCGMQAVPGYTVTVIQTTDQR